MSALYHDDSPLVSKRCSNCGIEKPLEEFNRSARGLGGRRGDCKVCYGNPRMLIVQAPLFVLSKICTKCGIKKPLDDFFRSARGLGGRRGECKVCYMNPRMQIVQAPLFIFEKVCTKCGVEKPIEQFEKVTANRYASQCNGCRLTQKKDRVARQLAIEPPEISRVCSVCHIEKPIEQFYKLSHGRGGRTPGCKKCHDNYRRQWYKDHEEHVRRREKERYDPEKKREYNRTYHRANAERLRKYNHYYYDTHKEEHRTYAKAWQQANSLKMRQSNNKRRARKKNARIGNVSYKRILERDDYWCHICEKPIKLEDVVFDHVIPLDRGGSHSEDNIHVCHRVCNGRKFNNLLSEMTPFQRRGVE